MKIAALTDIHAMSVTLERALADARSEGFDALLILGDLLTYGVMPLETIALIEDAVARDGAILIAGNHDELYRTSPGATRYVDTLPEWLRETVQWTAEQVPAGALDIFDWVKDWSAGPLFAAHANPYVFGDWRYIRSLDDAEEAAIALAARGFRFGLFGHTHRPRRFDCAAGTIFTLGSLGQPRDEHDNRVQWAMVTINGKEVSVSPRPVEFDRDAHVRAIRATTMSEQTKARLCGFFT